MDYRGYIIKKRAIGADNTFYVALAPRAGGRPYGDVVAANLCSIGINRAVDRYLDTGRKQATA